MFTTESWVWRERTAASIYQPLPITESTLHSGTPGGCGNECRFQFAYRPRRDAWHSPRISIAFSMQTSGISHYLPWLQQRHELGVQYLLFLVLLVTEKQYEKNALPVHAAVFLRPGIVDSIPRSLLQISINALGYLLVLA